MSRSSSRTFTAVNDASVFGDIKTPDSLAYKIKNKYDSLKANNKFDDMAALVAATDNYRTACIHATQIQNSVLVLLRRIPNATRQVDVDNPDTPHAAAKRVAYQKLITELEIAFDDSQTVPSFMDGKEHFCTICNQPLINHGESDKVYAIDSEKQEYSGTGQIKCGHKYHKLCIKEWLKINNSCPICRSNVIKLRLANEEQVGGKKKRHTKTRKMNKKRSTKKRAI